MQVSKSASQQVSKSASQQVSKIVCVLVSMAMLLPATPSSVLAAGSDPIDYELAPYPVGAHPIYDGVTYSNPTNTTAPLTYAIFPFVDESGRSWSIRVDLVNGYYELRNASDVFLTTGMLSQDQLTIFSHAANERRRSLKDPTIGYIQPTYIVYAIGIAISLIGLYLQHQSLSAQQNATAAQAVQDAMQCEGDMARDNARAFADAARDCPPTLVAGGCYQRPVMLDANPGICFGGAYSGTCQVVCN